MESILARALEYTLKYWLKSFSRDQFKLQGRTVQLSNLDINGDALHSSIGLPPALNVTTAKVGKLVIMLPAVSNVQIEPIIVQIDRLDLVLEENQDVEACKSASSPSSSSTSTGWSSGYGFADKIADGMSVQINTVNLLLETRGGSREKGGATWASPMASVTMRNLMLYTTNENWEVVNLKEARDFFSSSKFIYVFKKLEWESLSVDLLPHPDMFTESNLERANEGANKRDDDGAKRVFFGGERFIEGISGEAYITVKRTELNRPLGLEVQLHINEVICPALSEPGLRALLRFLTGLYICLNRGDVDIMAQERSVEAAGISLVSLVVEHIFLCLKDAEFQLDILMQSLRFSRASVSDGESANNLTTVMIAGLFLRDTFSRPPCTLVQPSMQAFTKNTQEVPAFAKNFCPPIYPLGEQDWQRTVGIPLICLYSLQVKPSPDPPVFASETFINCQPLTIYLQEESCLRISSFLADGIVVGPGAILPDASINSFTLVLKELDVTVPLEMEKVYTPKSRKSIPHSSFNGAKLHIEDLLFKESPFLKLKLLNLEKDPACFCFWQGQPVDASQKKWTTKASRISLCLEASSDFNKLQQSTDWTSDVWRCVEVKDVCVEVAMATPDGSPLTDVPPPGGIVRVGVACQEYISNSSVEQLFFVLSLYGYIGRVSDKIAIVGKSSRRVNNKIQEDESVGGTGRLMDRVPADTAVSLIIASLELRFLESAASVNAEGSPLVQFIGDDFFMKVSHRTLGGAVAVSSSLHWDSVEIDCIDTERNGVDEKNGNLSPQCSSKLRAVLWIHNKKKDEANGRRHGGAPFLEISTTQVIPFNEQDSESSSLNLSAGVSGIRLGGGMNYAESLLHRFGILGPDGGPGKGLLKGLEDLSSGPLAKLFKSAPICTDDTNKGDGEDDILQLAKPENVDVTVELKDWLFALEGPEQSQERWQQYDNHDHASVGREERSWHMSFQSLQVAGKSDPKHRTKSVVRKYPIESVTIGIEGLQTVKPQIQTEVQSFSRANGNKEAVHCPGGINVEARMAMPIDNPDGDAEPADWVVDNLKFTIKKPIEAVVTKEELQHLVFLCKSEVDSMGRIAAGVLRLLKLENSIGQAAIAQLSNLGSEGLDKILTPKHSRRSSLLGFLPKTVGSSAQDSDDIHTTVASLEEAVLDSQAQCNSILHAISNNPGSSSSERNISDMEQLSQKLERMEFLLKELRRQI